jgi:hypothetical protein
VKVSLISGRPDLLLTLIFKFPGESLTATSKKIDVSYMIGQKFKIKD